MSDVNDNECTLCGRWLVRRGHFLNHITTCRSCNYYGMIIVRQLEWHERTCEGRHWTMDHSVQPVDHTIGLNIVDPKQQLYIGLDVNADDELVKTVTKSWQSKKTFCKCHAMQDVLNIRMWDPVDEDFETTLGDKVMAVWNHGHGVVSSTLAWAAC